MISKLLITSQDNGIEKEYPIVTDIPISITFQQADIRFPDKRNCSFSKTIELYATNELNILFENIFNVNIKTLRFNPNKKTSCRYLVDEIEQFKGSLQLVAVSISDNNNVVYSCNLRGNEANLFSDIGDKLLSDLDFSEYNHTYNRTNIINSWDNYTSDGVGYYYPFVDNGRNGGSNTNFIVEQFIPCFTAKEYIDKIISDAGYSYNSTLFNSGEFCDVYVYPNVKSITLSSSQLQSRQFYVGLNSDVTLTPSSFLVVDFNKETTPFFDSSPAQSHGTYAIISERGLYTITGIGVFNVTLTHTNPSVTHAKIFIYLTTQIRKSGNGGAGWFTVCQAVTKIDPVKVNINIGSNIFNAATSSGIYDLYTGDYVECRVEVRVGLPTYYDSSNNVVSTGTGTISYKLVSGSNGSSFYLLSAGNELMSGNSLDINTCLPKAIKQKDFLKSILQAFNMFIDVDKNNNKLLNIETYSHYFNIGNGGDAIVNWENKIDRDKPIEINPLFLIEGKRYEFTYKEDKDYYNTIYNANNNEIFGYKKVEIDNDFLKETKKNELIFSPTHNAPNYAIDAVYPKIYEFTDNKINQIVPNIRLLYANPTNSSNPYNFHDSSDNSVIQTTKLGYAGHCDSPTAPNVDLNFSFPKEVFYSYPALSFTTGNLYNKYHKLFLENITGRDSKVVICNLWLTPHDIYNFTFRKKYFIDGAYYLVNKIIDYTPYVQKSTKVELIKLVDVTVFTPTREDVTFDGTVTRSGLTPIEVRNTETRSVIYSDSVELINSNDIFVDSNSSKITLINSSNVQVIGVTDFIGIGLNDVVIDSSYSGKTINTSAISITEVIVPFYNASASDAVLNCTGNEGYDDTNVSLEDIVSVIGKEITIKNSSTGDIIINANQSPIYYIDGVETLTLAPSEVVTLLNTGTSFIKI